MALRSRVLLIEDEKAQAEAIEHACRERASRELSVTVARNAEEARAAIAADEFDLIVCDLALPPHAGTLDIDRQQGIDLLMAIRRDHPGTPVLVLSGYLDVPVAQEIAEASRSVDIFGSDNERQLVRSFRKQDLDDCVAVAGEMLAEIEGLADVAIQITDETQLSPSHERTLQIFGRRNNGSIVRASDMGGGLSGVQTLRVEVIADPGGRQSLAAAKLGPLDRILGEARRYDQIAGLLPPGLGAPFLRTVDAGSGAEGGVFYRLADEHTRSLFDCLPDSEHETCQVIEKLRDRFRDTYADASVLERPLKDIRSGFIGDAVLRDLSYELSFLDAAENLRIPVSDCTQHGDLHGTNVLVNPSGEPLLIDYADVRTGPAATDPVTLELSTVFHPAARDLRGDWPSPASAAAWLDVDRFVEDCPFPDFIRACREWTLAVSRSSQEPAATALAYVLRQLKYDDPPHEPALRIAEACASHLQSEQGAS